MVSSFFFLFQCFFRIILFLCLSEPKVGLMKILLVEDDANLREVTQRSLEKAVSYTHLIVERGL